MSDRVREFWESEARVFDTIYTGKKKRFAAWLDRVFRWDMAARFDATLRECGDARGKEILDVGCGSGRYAIELARRGARVTGVDNAAEMLTMARRLAGEAGVAEKCRFVENGFLSFSADRVFDITLAIGFFDYTADPIPYLRGMRGMTQGKLIATFPRLWTWRAPFRKVRLGLRGCPVHFYTRRKVRRILEECGWRVEKAERLGKLHFVVGIAA